MKIAQNMKTRMSDKLFYVVARPMKLSIHTNVLKNVLFLWDLKFHMPLFTQQYQLMFMKNLSAKNHAASTNM